MSSTPAAAPAPLTLSPVGVRAFGLQIALLTVAVALPAVAHTAGLPVRQLLPMHWPVLLAGLVYGWRTGAVVGVGAPLVSHLLTGFPLTPVLPAMVLELGLYGGIAGALRGQLRWNPFIAMAGAVLAGRIGFILAALLGGATARDGGYLMAALLPGIGAALAQIAVLPPLAALWVRAGRDPAHGGGPE